MRQGHSNLSMRRLQERPIFWHENPFLVVEIPILIESYRAHLLVCAAYLF